MAVAAAACGDDGGSGDADGAVGFDAAASYDADTRDAEPLPIDAVASGTATITINSSNGPVQGIDVVWYDPDGNVQAHEATNIAGQASEDIRPGSDLVIAVMAGPTPITINYIDIEPGDDLVWTFGGGNDAQISNLTVNLPGNYANADNYRIEIGCNERQEQSAAAPATNIAVFESCLGSDQTIDVVGMAFNGDQLLAYDVDTGVTVNTQGTTTATLDAWQTSYDPLTMTLANAPTEVMGAGVEMHPRIDGVSFVGPSGGGGVSNGDVVINSGYWQGVTIDAIQYLSFMPRGTQMNPEGLSILLASRSGTPATIDHDLDNLLPTITEVAAADSSGELSLSWTGSLASGDGTLVIASWTDNATNHGAYIMLPPTATSPFVMPELPAALSTFETSGAAVFDDPTLIAVEADFFPGYAAFRVDGWQIFGDGALDLLPADGVIYAHLGGALPGQMNAPLRLVPRLDATAIQPRP